jgi:hypothetical protein
MSMADDRPGDGPRQKTRTSSGDDDGARRTAGRGRRPPDTRQIVRAALEQLIMLVDRPVTGVIGFHRTDHGWRIEAEVLELERVPDTMSIVASYEIEVDEHGELEGYRRLRRYPRGTVDEG